MENITLKSMLQEFSVKSELSVTESLSFERFVSYSMLANDYYDSFDAERVSTGDCVGVDAVAISISDVLVYTEQEARNYTNGQFDGRFNFIQTKTSNNLDLGDYLKFLQTVYLFFTGTLEEQPSELKDAYLIKSHIYAKASRFRDMPKLTMSYVYTGSGKIDNPTFKSQVDSLANSIQSLPYLFSVVESNLVGANELADRYKETLNRTTKRLHFQRHVALPKLSSASAAYLGVARCLDYIEILKNQDGQINKGAFYDNVRDYLGSTNPVNADIEKTIKSTSERNLFSVLNNGVTVVAKKVVPSGDVFEVSGFQVVNGCQTSHVLFNNRDAVTDDMYITVKLIETNDVDLTSSVIKATNSQSLVMKEAFATIKPYHKQLEDFFKAMNSKGYRFYYERRPHQFDDYEGILNSEIVSAPLLIKSFVSVVIEEPHKVHFYYGQILRDYNTDKSTLLFEETHHPGLYFVSHLLVTKAKEIASRNKIKPSDWTYHLALLLKKRLEIKLNLHDKLTDSTVLQMVNKINEQAGAVSDELVRICKSANLKRDENMIPEKTTLLLDLLKQKIREKYISQSLTAKSVEPHPLTDGIYVVKECHTKNGTIKFSYGSKVYTLALGTSSVPPSQMSRATIDIKNGQIVNVTG